MSLRRILEPIRTSGWTGLLLLAARVGELVSPPASPWPGVAVALASCTCLATGTVALRSLARRGVPTRLAASVWVVLYGLVAWAPGVLRLLGAASPLDRLHPSAGLTMVGALGIWFGLGILMAMSMRLQRVDGRSAVRPLEHAAARAWEV